MHRDESVRTVLWNSATLFLPDGQTPLATIAQGQDITERKQAEQALRESETRLRSLFDDSPISLWEEDFSAVKRRLDDLRAEGVVDFDVYLCQHPEVVSECIALVRVLDVNKATLTLFGATSKENMVKNLATSLPEAGNESFRTELVWIASGATHFEMEMIAQTVNGKMITVNLNWAVVHGYEDDLSKVIVSIENISERKRSEVEITRTLSILESTMESTADGILVADGKGGIVRFNLRFRDMWNIPEPIIAAKDDEAAISFVICQLTEPEIFLKTVRNLYDASEQISFDVLELKDGRVIERYSQPQRIGDLVVGRVWSFRDVTERKRAENALHAAHAELEQRVIERTAELQAANLELEKSARMKDEFLASMSHELRTPLTGILGLSDVMQMPHIGPLNEKQRSYLTNIHSSGERLLEIINDMLDFSMIESGKVNLSLNPCSLKEICQSSLQLTESQASAKGLQSNLSITPENILLNADARRLQKILVNLLGNAVKFTPKNGSFGIEARGDRTVGQVKITVWDNGIGIQEQDLPRLFQPFIQLDARLGRQYEGTGLGLAMVRRLTELHGGSVSVQSVPGQGSRFTVTLAWQPV
jgi:signal transduction histidine kinase